MRRAPLGVFGIGVAGALSLATAALGQTPADREIASRLEQLSRDVKALEPEDGLDAASVGAIAALIAAAIAAGASAWVTRRTIQAQVVVGRDATLVAQRLPKYAALFKLFKELPEQKPPSVSKTRIAQLTRELTDWYYEEGGGLVLSRLAQRVFRKSRAVIAAVCDGDAATTLTDDEYAAVYFCCSTLRSALIDDVDGRRRLGDAPTSEVEEYLETFLAIEEGDAPRMIGWCARQQRANANLAR